MPIPTGGAWPPPHVAPAYDAYRDWDTWYTGDPDQLRTVYNGRGTTNSTNALPPSLRTRPTQLAGGVLGYFSRWLWGTPPPVDSRDARLHAPLAADLAMTAANLLFSEPPQLSSDAPAAQLRMEQLAEDGIVAMLLHAAEANSFLGDVYLRPTIDKDVLPRAFLSSVHADGAIPTIRWGKLLEVTFWSSLVEEGDTVVRLLEHHEPGRIIYRLFEGTAHNLGRPVPYAEAAPAAYLADLVDANGAQATGITNLDVVRVPNTGPQRQWRKNSSLKYLGRSDYAGNEQYFDAIDETWTSWMRDLRLAKARISVPEYMLQSNGVGAGASWDPDREIYSQLNMLPDAAGGKGLTVTQFAIRAADHKATLDALVETALRHAGLSSQTLGDEGAVAITATEVQARERQSFTTRGNRIQTWAPAIAEAIELLMAVERAAKLSTVDPVRPNVEFGDSVSEAPETTARTVQLLDAASAVSTETKVRMVHPAWDEDQVKAEVVLIEEGKQPIVVPNPDTFTGDNLPPDGGQAQGDQNPGGSVPPAA